MKNNRFMAYRSFWAEPEMTKHFGNMGINTVGFISSNCMNSLGEPYCDYPPIWIGPNTYEFSHLDAQINDIKSANPNAKMICIIDLNSPQWWVRYNMYKDGVERSADSLTELGRVASNPLWRKETGNYLRAFLEHSEKNHSDCICAYMLSCGTTSEWFDLSQGEESPSRVVAYCKWCMNQGENSQVDIPVQSVRNNITHKFLRDPEKDKQAINYWRFCNFQIAETALYYAGITQKRIEHRVPLGIFFGYIMELPDLPANGHLDYEKIYSSPDLDFFLAPGPYGTREMGAYGGTMVPAGTINLKGKMFLQELDHRTYTANRFPTKNKGFECYPYFWKDRKESIAGLKREFSFAFIEGDALWWFDMWSGWYEDEAIRKEIAKMSDVWEKYSEEQCESTTEIAVFLDPESVYYMDSSNKMYSESLGDIRFPLGKLGAPYKVFSVNDIEGLDLDKFKLLIFPNLYVVNDSKRKLLKKACENHRTILWFYAPGIISDEKYNEANVEKLTGVSFGTEKISKTKMGNWNSVYSFSPSLSYFEMRAIALNAGVHLYGEEGDPVFANKRFLAYHSSVSGNKHIKFPSKYSKIIDLLDNNKIMGEDTDSISVYFNAPETFLYELVP
jgi:hypothetical protein